MTSHSKRGLSLAQRGARKAVAPTSDRNSLVPHLVPDHTRVRSMPQPVPRNPNRIASKWRVWVGGGEGGAAKVVVSTRLVKLGDCKKKPKGVNKDSLCCVSGGLSPKRVCVCVCVLNFNEKRFVVFFLELIIFSICSKKGASLFMLLPFCLERRHLLVGLRPCVVCVSKSRTREQCLYRRNLFRWLCVSCKAAAWSLGCASGLRRVLLKSLWLHLQKRCEWT